jgi:flagellar protein FlgJ
MKINSDQYLSMLQERTKAQQDRTTEKEFVEKLNQLQNSESTGEEREEKLKKVSQKFSALFVNLMLKEMRKTIPKSEYLDGGLKEDIFREKLDQEYVKEISSSKQLSIAKSLYEQLSKSAD